VNYLEVRNNESYAGWLVFHSSFRHIGFLYDYADNGLHFNWSWVGRDRVCFVFYSEETFGGVME